MSAAYRGAIRGRLPATRAARECAQPPPTTRNTSRGHNVTLANHLKQHHRQDQELVKTAQQNCGSTRRVRHRSPHGENIMTARRVPKTNVGHNVTRTNMLHAMVQHRRTDHVTVTDHHAPPHTAGHHTRNRQCTNSPDHPPGDVDDISMHVRHNVQRTTSTFHQLTENTQSHSPTTCLRGHAAQHTAGARGWQPGYLLSVPRYLPEPPQPHHRTPCVITRVPRKSAKRRPCNL